MIKNILPVDQLENMQNNIKLDIFLRDKRNSYDVTIEEEEASLRVNLYFKVLGWWKNQYVMIDDVE